MADTEAPTASELSKKIDIVINILLHFALKDEGFNGGKHTAGDLALWLNGVGLSNTDIATILGSSPGSIRVLLHKKKGKKVKTSKDKKGK